MERETGIEPATSSLGSWRSTAELLPLTDARGPSQSLGISPAGSTPAKRLNLGSWRSTAELLPLGAGEVASLSLAHSSNNLPEYCWTFLRRSGRDARWTAAGTAALLRT